MYVLITLNVEILLMIMTTSMVVNELLCYVQNNFSKHPRALLGTAMNGFYTDDEAATAKMCLYEAAKSMNIQGLPRLIKRQGDNKRKMDCEDILDLFALMDKSACNMPMFVAANLQRLPTVSPGDVDVYGLAASVTAMMARLDELTKKVESGLVAADMTQQVMAVVKRLDACEAVLYPPLVSGEFASAEKVGVLNENIRMSYVQSALKPPMVTPPKPKPAPVIRVKGTAANHTVKAVPRSPPKPLVKAFVGRMDPETTEEDLRSSLVEAGLDVVHCRRLKVPDGKTFKTAAFYVACTVESSELFYNEETWPEGVEIRDWYTSSS